MGSWKRSAIWSRGKKSEWGRLALASELDLRGFSEAAGGTLWPERFETFSKPVSSILEVLGQNFMARAPQGPAPAGGHVVQLQWRRPSLQDSVARASRPVSGQGFSGSRPLVVVAVGAFVREMFVVLLGSSVLGAWALCSHPEGVLEAAIPRTTQHAGLPSPSPRSRKGPLPCNARKNTKTKTWTINGAPRRGARRKRRKL